MLGVLVVVHLASWPVVMVVSMIEGAGGTIFDPAVAAALPGIVADGQFEQAWAATEARSYGAVLAGPALGGVLFGLGRAVPFLADAVSYGISFGTVCRIRGRFRAKSAVKRKVLWREDGRTGRARGVPDRGGVRSVSRSLTDSLLTPLTCGGPGQAGIIHELLSSQSAVPQVRLVLLP